MDRWEGDELGTAAYDAGEGEWVEPSLQSEAVSLGTAEALDEAFFKILNRRTENLQDEVLEEMTSKQV